MPANDTPQPTSVCETKHLTPPTKSRKQDNMGEIIMPGKGPADPLKDEATRLLSHRGGEVSARAELY